MTEPPPTAMPPGQRAFLAACAGVIGYAIAYVLSDFGPLVRLTYFPEEHQWQLIERPPTPVPMAYYGMPLWGLGGAVVGAALVYGASRVVDRPVPDRWLQLAAGWALSAVVLACAYFLWNLWPF